MNRILLLTGVFLLGFTNLIAQEVDSLSAKNTATIWLEQSGESEYEIKCIHDFNNESLNIWCIELHPGGFILTPKYMIAKPILAYSFSNPNIIGENPLFQSYLSELSDAIQKELLAKPEQTHIQWQNYKSGKIEKTLTNEPISVPPLIETTWGQGYGYNQSCPEHNSGPGGHTVVGCGPLAIGQIMKYWDYPLQGNSQISYSTLKYGELHANFGDSYYQWGKMAFDSYSFEASQLLYHCGVALMADYGPFSTGSDVKQKGPDALIQYFCYDSSANYVWKNLYSDTDWEKLLIEQLEHQQPVLYRASDQNSSSSHAFVVDGYQNGYFHINWGWDGVRNGYFSLNNFDVNNYEFSEFHGAIIDIIPLDPQKAFPPRNLQGVAQPEVINLKWNSPYKNLCQSYEIFRNNKLIAIVSDTIFSDSEVLGDSIYKYHILAEYNFDGIKKLSSALTAVKVKALKSFDLPYTTTFEVSSGWGPLVLTEGSNCFTHLNSQADNLGASGQIYSKVKQKLELKLESPIFKLSNEYQVCIQLGYGYTKIKSCSNVCLAFRNIPGDEWIEIQEFYPTSSIASIERDTTVCFWLDLPGGLKNAQFAVIHRVKQISQGNSYSEFRLTSFQLESSSETSFSEFTHYDFSSNTVDLYWKVATSSMPIEYTIYRDKEKLASISTKHFHDVSTDPEKLHKYYVVSHYPKQVDRIGKTLAVRAVGVIKEINDESEITTNSWYSTSGCVWNRGNNNQIHIRQADADEAIKQDEKWLYGPAIFLKDNEKAVLRLVYQYSYSHSFIQQEKPAIHIMTRRGHEAHWERIGELKISAQPGIVLNEEYVIPSKNNSTFTQLALVYEQPLDTEISFSLESMFIRSVIDLPTSLSQNASVINDSICLSWTPPLGRNPDYYTISHNDEEIAKTTGLNLSIPCISSGHYVYAIQSVFPDGISQKIYFPEILPACPVTEEFSSEIFGWTIINPSGQSRIVLQDASLAEGMENSTGFLQMTLPENEYSSSVSLLSPPIKVTRNDELYLSYWLGLTGTSGCRSNKLYMRKHSDSVWKQLPMLRQENDPWLYKFYQYSLPTDFLQKGDTIQLGFVFKKNDASGYSEIKIDQLQVSHIAHSKPPIRFRLHENTDSLIFTWEPPYNCPDPPIYELYRNLEKIASTSNRSKTFPKSQFPKGGWFHVVSIPDSTNKWPSKPSATIIYHSPALNILSRGYPKGFNLYPNPFNQTFRIEQYNQTEGEVKIHIWDMNGTIIHQEEILQLGRSHEISGENWAPGIYNVRIQTKDESTFSRMVKIK